MPEQKPTEVERSSLLHLLEDWLEKPMLVLAFAWLALLVVELTFGLGPVLETVGTVIWAIFVLDFVLRFSLAPRKGAFLKANWLTLLSLLFPALRFARIGRALRFARLAPAARGVRLVRVLSAVNRGMRALGSTMARRGAGYVAGLTLIVLLAGAAGMYAFERGASDHRAFQTFGGALWWTAMIPTTMGSESWPATPEGKLLCLFLSVYAFAVFGYLAAVLASYFVGRDKADRKEEATVQAALQALREEVSALRRDLRPARAGAGERRDGEPSPGRSTE